MLKKTESIKLAFGTINDDKVLGYIGEFKEPEIENKIDFEVYTDPLTGFTLYVYKDGLYTYKELRRAYLEDYYDVG